MHNNFENKSNHQMHNISAVTKAYYFSDFGILKI